MNIPRFRIKFHELADINGSSIEYAFPIRDLFESNRIAFPFPFHDSILKNIIVRREYKFSIF